VKIAPARWNPDLQRAGELLTLGPGIPAGREGDGSSRVPKGVPGRPRRRWHRRERPDRSTAAAVAALVALIVVMARQRAQRIPMRAMSPRRTGRGGGRVRRPRGGRRAVSSQRLGSFVLPPQNARARLVLGGRRWPVSPRRGMTPHRLGTPVGDRDRQQDPASRQSACPWGRKTGNG
jgi:hypothetical protein